MFLIAQTVVCEYGSPCMWPGWLAGIVIAAIVIIAGVNILKR